jgi:hypothetical protein
MQGRLLPYSQWVEVEREELVLSVRPALEGE